MTDTEKEAIAVAGERVCEPRPGPMYPPLHAWDLEPHYSVHVAAMTTEGLHDKAAIAEQLAWRDQQNEALRADREHLEKLADVALEYLATIEHAHPHWLGGFGELLDAERLRRSKQWGVAVGSKHYRYELGEAMPMNPYTKPNQGER